MMAQLAAYELNSVQLSQPGWALSAQHCCTTVTVL